MLIHLFKLLLRATERKAVRPVDAQGASPDGFAHAGESLSNRPSCAPRQAPEFMPEPPWAEGDVAMPPPDRTPEQPQPQEADPPDEKVLPFGPRRPRPGPERRPDPPDENDDDPGPAAA